MIKKEKKVVITFHTTTEAMAMEKICKETGAAGRMIPVPPVISAGCGLAWCAPPDEEASLRVLMEEKKIRYQEIHVCII